MKYLGSFRRVVNTVITNVYHYCNAYGVYLHWQYGNEQLRIFFKEEVGLTYFGMFSSFNYTVTLLSSKKFANKSNERLASILILTFRGKVPNSFQVTCTSSLGINRTDSVNHYYDVKDTVRTTDRVSLQYVLQDQLVKNRTSTFMFVCATANKQQLITVDGWLFAFTRRDDEGDYRTILSSNEQIANVQGILIYRDSVWATSVLFISHDSDVQVTCYYGNNTATINTNKRYTTTTLPLASIKTNSTNNPGTLNGGVCHIITNTGHVTSVVFFRFAY